MTDPRRHAPATTRNRAAILAVLGDTLAATGTALEIASGTGEHAAFFATALPGLHWQPSDTDPDARASISAHCAGIANVAPPLAIDAAAKAWPIDRADAIVCINMIHIAPWQATTGLVAGAGRLLATGAPLVLYGPFIVPGTPTAPSNLDFDASLRARDPAWGLRDLALVDEVAAAHGFVREQVVAMPANNLSVVFRRT